MKLEVGMKIEVEACSVENLDIFARKQKKKMVGEICYIHPKRRFFGVKFKSGIIECFQMGDYGE